VAESIRLDEWLDELKSLRKESVDGFTSTDVAGKMGRSLTWTRGMMRRAFEAGKLTMVGTREMTRMDGRPCWVPVYRVVKKAK